MKLEALYIGKLFYFINVKISYIAIFGNQKIVIAISQAWDMYSKLRQETLNCSVLICN